MSKKHFFIRFLLFPLSFLYGMLIACRNFFFNIGIFKSESFPIPIICVGNISVGGTGKTPHVEHIIEILKKDYRLAVVTRGYKRKTKGLIIANTDSTAEEIGDEPRQIKLKYPDVTLAVDGNRRRAIRYLLSMKEDVRPQVIIMDDGFQHRYVKPSYSVVLIDFNRPITSDYLLPLGNLREQASARYRANMIIVTKKPKGFKPIDKMLYERGLNLYPYQHLYFSSIEYQAPRPLLFLGQETTDSPITIGKNDKVVAVSGIASPKPFVQQLEKAYTLIGQKHFPDHHNFTKKDIESLNTLYTELQAKADKAIFFVCTEKDAVRLHNLKEWLSPDLLEHLYYLPITISVGANKEEEFNLHIKQAAQALPATLQE